MGQTLTNVDAILKDVYRNLIVTTLNKKVRLLDLYEKNDDASIISADGRQVLYPLHYGRNVGVSSVAESATLPVAGNQQTAQVKVGYKYTYGRIQLTEQSIEASASNAGAFTKVVEFEMKNLLNDLKRVRNRHLTGWGTGILCKVSGQQSSATTLNIKDPGGVVGNVGAGRYLQVNDVVAIVRNATPTSAADSDIQAAQLVVSSLSTDLNTITFTAATGITANDGDLIVQATGNTATESSVNKEPMGLLGMIDDGTYLTTIANINRSTVDQYKSTVISWNAPIDFNIMQRLEDAADEKGGSFDKWICHHSVRREIMKLYMSAKRFNDEKGMKPDAGFKGSGIDDDLMFNDKPIMAERMTPYGMLFGVDKSNNVRYVNAEGKWSDLDGSILKRTADKAIFEGRFRVFDNFHNDRPDACGRIDGISATVDVIRAE